MIYKHYLNHIETIQLILDSTLSTRIALMRSGKGRYLIQQASGPNQIEIENVLFKECGLDVKFCRELIEKETEYAQRIDFIIYLTELQCTTI